MLKQQTRKRLQALVQNPSYMGSIYIHDSKFIHDSDHGVPTFRVSVDIHGEGFNVFTLLAELFPDMTVNNVRPYETDQGNYFTFGSYADGTIEEANVNIWAKYGERAKEKAPLPEGAIEEITQPDSITETWTLEEILRREA